MLIFKFGGASVKDAEAVQNVANILSQYKDEKVVVIISAMGKTTNALELVVESYMSKSPDLIKYLNEVKSYHLSILEGLDFKSDHPVRNDIENCFTEIEWVLEEEPSREYNFIYDQIVSQGEMMSTKIISAYLKAIGITNEWLDVRDVLQTNNRYRDAQVNWELSTRLMNERIPNLQKRSNFIITQGFIGGTSENYTTTLGREGSDFTAAIFSYCLNATEMVVWKDVPGVLSADPKFSDEAVKLDEISYHDAIELTYYGATVIHPKTIKPLENKNIPLRVRSFKSPADKGTSIAAYASTKPLVPCFIFKTKQILLSISSKDFSFIAEESLSKIYHIFAELNIKINLMQNSAITFSVCMDNDPFKIPHLIERLKLDFHVLYNENLRLITIRHYYPSTIEALLKGKEILLEQRSRHTAQLVLHEPEGLKK
ncbi:MAG TPA: aspartate kinase [Bacteroidia bacterium]|nr:aspartate kinase [Bacteroidia bacterium]